MKKNNSAFMPTNDYVFKRLFGHKGNEHITKSLLESILDIKIENIEVESSKVLERDLKDDKLGILDILANFNNTTQCDVEMQMVSYDNLTERILDYWSKVYEKSIKAGDNYNTAKKTIAVLIASFDIDFKIPKYLTKWHIKEDDFPQIVLTPLIEICIIPIGRFEKMQKENIIAKNKDISVWLKFIRDPNSLEVEDMENEEIKNAKEEYDEIMSDEREQRLAELRMKHILDIKAVQRKGYKDGVEEVARNLLKANVGINVIINATGLTKEEIEKLKE